MSSQKKAPAGAELQAALKRQVEFYFSRANLANDAFLVSQMNSQMYVPVDVILKFSKVQELTDSAELLVAAVADSTVCSLNEAQDAIKPNIKAERTTIILREIPSATPPADVEAVFAAAGAAPASVRSDVGDTWFVAMHSEDEAVQTLLALRSQTFNGAAIKARLKSENLLKAFYPTQVAENTLTPAIGTPYGGRGYFGGYYDGYGAQYGRGGHSNGHAAGAARGGRGAFRGGRTGPTPAKESKAKAGEQQPRSARKTKGEKRKEKKDGAEKKEAGDKEAGEKKEGKKDRQPILSSANFPPLPAVPADKATVTAIVHSYAHEDIMEIVKNMDDHDCTLPAGKMDFDKHPAALTATAHPDLLRNQRTYSIEQAREAMRQGRPIRSDSVGSIDYESMMYGEDYTKDAREQRQAAAVTSPTAATPAAPAAPTPAVKVVGYAAAVIHGTPAPAPVAAKKPAAPAKKDEKPAKQQPAKQQPAKQQPAKSEAASATKAQVAEEKKTTAGAWGGRNFLDVVKSEPKKEESKQ